jgi:hypothetical protein
VVTPVRLIVALAVVLLASSTSSAQRREPKVYSGMFGQTPVEMERPVHLDLTGSIYNAVDDQQDQTLAITSDTANQMFTGATASLAASRRGGHSYLTLNLASAGRYYADLGEVVTMRHTAAVGLNAAPGKNWRLNLSGSAQYSPLYQVVFGPSGDDLWAPQVQSPLDDFAVSPRRAIQYGSMIGVTHTYSDRQDLSLTYDGHYTQVLGATALSDFSSQRAGFQFNQAISRGFGLRLGYAYGVATTLADLSAAETIRNHEIDLGVAYGRSFKTSPRTSFNFSTGSTIVSYSEGRTFRITGSGRLTRRMSPRWTADLTYDRGVQVPEGATRPFFSDSFTGIVTGYFSRRISLRAQPIYSHGEVGFVGEPNSYNSYTSQTRLEVALNRHLALYTEHVLYRYQFENDLGIPRQLRSGVNQQTVRVGLTLWTPLVR